VPGGLRHTARGTGSALLPSISLSLSLSPARTKSEHHKTFEGLSPKKNGDMRLRHQVLPMNYEGEGVLHVPACSGIARPWPEPEMA